MENAFYTIVGFGINRTPPQTRMACVAACTEPVAPYGGRRGGNMIGLVRVTEQVAKVRL